MISIEWYNFFYRKEKKKIKNKVWRIVEYFIGNLRILGVMEKLINLLYGYYLRNWRSACYTLYGRLVDAPIIYGWFVM